MDDWHTVDDLWIDMYSLFENVCNCIPSFCCKYTILYFVVDCVWSAWNEWSSCSETCGDGSRSQERSVEQESANGGRSCDSPQKFETCKFKDCSGMLWSALTFSCKDTRWLYFCTIIVDCKWSAWNEWTPCSVTCGNGTITQERYEEQQSAFGGKPCEGQRIKTEECKITDCPGI